jgi:hypothetical protein
MLLPLKSAGTTCYHPTVPTKQKRVEILLTESELKAIKRLAKDQSLSNYFRVLANLKPLPRGARKGKGE